MVKRGEALNDGLPRDNVVQDDQILCGVGQMSLDPLRRERVLKCLCYHGMDLCLGCRETPFRHYPTDQRSQKHALGEKISGYYVRHTKWGRATRAVAEQPDVAAACGVNINLVSQLTVSIASLMAGAAGVTLGLLYTSAAPFMGLLFGLKSFVYMLVAGNRHIEAMAPFKF